MEVVHLEILHLWHVHSLLIGAGIQGGFATCSKLQVILVKDNVLDIVLGHRSHKQLLLGAVFVSCQDLIAIREELEDLLEHRGHAGKRLGHLRGSLLGEGLKALGPFSELLELTENLLRLTLELLLQNLDGLSIVQLLFSQVTIIAEKLVNLSK